MTWFMIGFTALRLLGLIFVGLLGYRAALAVGEHFREREASCGKRRSQDRALAILAERYARGEIGETEFAERKAVLES